MGRHFYVALFLLLLKRKISIQSQNNPRNGHQVCSLKFQALVGFQMSVWVSFQAKPVEVQLTWWLLHFAHPSAAKTSTFFSRWTACGLKEVPGTLFAIRGPTPQVCSISSRRWGRTGLFGACHPGDWTLLFKLHFLQSRDRPLHQGCYSTDFCACHILSHSNFSTMHRLCLHYSHRCK